ncbi:MAG TPA: pilus assembly protein N-terminal domain-containing protein [Vicinamibacterales bacterium]|nr:pilus assembly protein N-terminal domain-containing protein [Vicinamibacterales bacterium]
MSRTFTTALAAYIIVILVAQPQAQQSPAFVSTGVVSGPAVAAAAAPTAVNLLVGRSTILDIGGTISRVSLTVPDVADAMVTAPTQLLIHGKQPGTISMFVWDRMGAIKTYEIVVRRDLSALTEQVKQLFPGEPITVAGSGKDVVLSGTVTSKYVMDKAADVAAGYVDKKENVVNLLTQQEGVASNQVMLRVRFAEVSRSAVQELGASLFTGPTGYKDWVARTSTQQFSSPNFNELSRTSDLDDNLTGASGKYTLSDFLNIFIFNNKYNVGAVVKALQEKGLFQSLAEPNLVATNGKEASFLAGGEFPIPVVQNGSGGNSVSVQFKEFGVRLSFTPTVLGGDLINLKVKPEVSALDFANAVVLDGFRIPALTTRRTETEVELRDGQTFAIAGLLNNTVTDTMRKIPGIGDIPILGWLFKSKAMQKSQTELVVMITPTIIRRGQMGVSQGLPSNVEPFMGAPDKRLPPQDPYVGSPRYPANQPAPRDPNLATSAAASVPVADQKVAPAPVAVTRQSTPAPQAKRVPEPVPSTPINAPAPLPAAPKADKKQAAANKKAWEAAEKQRIADEKRKADEASVAAKKLEEQKRQAERIEKERARQQAEADRKAAEDARRKQEEDQKRDKSLADAAARLKQAQSAYQAELAKTSKGGQ